MCELIKRALRRAMDNKKEITIIDDCYSDRAVVIAVGSDSVTVCDYIETHRILNNLQSLATKFSAKAYLAFRQGNMRLGLQHGHHVKIIHGMIVKNVNMLSIRTIKFNDLIGFTV